ncbi:MULTISPECIES: ABC transporter ATP-binding protein [unclassified Thalassospira]|jgi:branched-chain amino acid transport system ATP-binding protein|uniref:ABC transporter ATP-binding protein n=1 Tax=unclassified Thalassospira TaxID=2648997 RepID=UPI000A1F79D8|nr:ABC transporter ATP-binding protein [Thalassospira sp. MCCC 1A01428]OSQ42209.1 ABC transporter ATP-binding protein [Thalassospira sp. MCCC 1A01428]
MLELQNVETGYGGSQVLFGVNMQVEKGQIVSLLGRNGMGKTTTVRSIMGLTPAKAGSIRFKGQEISRHKSFRIARAGIGLVPEGRQIFPNLSVRENLVATARGQGWNLEKIYDLFPRLAERQNNMGNQLSGGEQQMLAIGRALLTNPDLLIFDEASEGLAPVIRTDIWACIRKLRDLAQTVLIIDGNLDALMAVCDRHYVLEKGQIVWNGSSEQFANAPEIKKNHLGI